jgi:hypothetical protein
VIRDAMRVAEVAYKQSLQLSRAQRLRAKMRHVYRSSLALCVCVRVCVCRVPLLSVLVPFSDLAFYCFASFLCGVLSVYGWLCVIA